MKDEKCAVACRKRYTNKEEDEKKLQLLKTGMQLSYQHHWIVGKIQKITNKFIWKINIIMYNICLDNMPVTWCYPLKEDFQYCSIGFPMGCFVKENWNPQDSCSIDVSLNK